MLTHHPANLLLRLVLEITALVGMGQWGWSIDQGSVKYLAAFGIPLLAGAVWVVFKTTGDPWLKKQPLIPIPGKARLLLEAVFFFTAVLCFLASGQIFLGLIFTVTLLLHYFWSAERVVWLWKN